MNYHKDWLCFYHTLSRWMRLCGMAPQSDQCTERSP